MPDRERFARALEVALSRNRESIGTYKEKTLHNTLKTYFGGEFTTEVGIGRFVADAVGEKGIYEIHTGSFFRMREKLRQFLSVSAVTVVYPVVRSKVILWADGETGEVTSRVKSPKHASIYRILPELYGIRELLASERLSFVCAVVECEEYRYTDGYGKGKRKGATKVDIIPTALCDEVEFGVPEDYLMFLPDTLPEEFTSADYSRATGLTRADSGKALLVLKQMGAVTPVQSRGRAIVYTIK